MPRTRTSSSPILEPSPADGVRSPWMRPRATADYVGIAIGTLRNLTSAKGIPHVKRGRIVRYHKDQIDAWLSKGACRGRTTLVDMR